MKYSSKHTGGFFRSHGQACAATILLAAAVTLCCTAAARAQNAATSEPADPAAIGQQIDHAIADLSSSEWRTREKAVHTLWSLGNRAVAKLNIAAKSTDPEVAARATEILDKFAAGIYADTPKEVVPLLKALREHKAQEFEVVSKLQELGPAGYKTLAIIAPHELHRTLCDLVAQDKLDQARELLIAVCETGSDTPLADFAALCCSEGQLDAEIARLNGLAVRTAPAEKCLAYLYRAKGDAKSAMDAARRSADQDLITALLIEQADWKALADAEAAVQTPDQEAAIVDHLGHLAAYARLAGREKQAQDALDQLVRLAKSNSDLCLPIAKALLINQRPGEALEIFSGPGGNIALAAGLMSQLGRTDEAVALLEKARTQPNGAAAGLDMLLGQMNLLAGNRAGPGN